MLDKMTELRPRDILRWHNWKAESLMHFAIRQVEASDIGAVHAILTSAHVVEGTMRMPNAPLATTEERLKEKPDRVQLIAELDGEAVGFAEVLTEFANPRARHAAVLNLIATREDMQCKGVCTALLEAVIDRGRDHWGLRRLGLVVWADNLPAIRLYERHGFEPEGLLKDYVRSGARFKNALAMARLFPEI